MWRGTGVEVNHQEADFADYTNFDGNPVELTEGCWSDVDSRL